MKERGAMQKKRNWLGISASRSRSTRRSKKTFSIRRYAKRPATTICLMKPRSSTLQQSNSSPTSKRCRSTRSFYDAKVKVLSEQIDHHVEEEEDKLFPEVQKTNLDLAALGEELATRKA